MKTLHYSVYVVPLHSSNFFPYIETFTPKTCACTLHVHGGKCSTYETTLETTLKRRRAHRSLQFLLVNEWLSRMSKVAGRPRFTARFSVRPHRTAAVKREVVWSVPSHRPKTAPRTHQPTIPPSHRATILDTICPAIHPISLNPNVHVLNLSGFCMNFSFLIKTKLLWKSKKKIKK